MKLYGILGNGSGKLGQSVAANVGGTMILRQYNPNVSNPKTAAQVAQRSRMKLASQLGAAFAPVIVIPKDGLKSARNIFIKKIMPLISVTEGVAECELDKIQLTAGSIALPSVVATKEGTSAINVALAENAAGIADRVAYCIFRITEDGQLAFVGSTIANDGGAAGTFAAALPYVDGSVVIYAYGMKDGSAAASTKYDNYDVDAAEGIASLISDRSLNAADYTFTQTSGLVIDGGAEPVGEPVVTKIDNENVVDKHVRVNFTDVVGDFTVVGQNLTGEITCEPKYGSTEEVQEGVQYVIVLAENITESTLVNVLNGSEVICTINFVKNNE